MSTAITSVTVVPERDDDDWQQAPQPSVVTLDDMTLQGHLISEQLEDMEH